MSNNKLFIPKKIRVGYKYEEETYNGRLAYVIYFDLKGNICKEKSWLSWCQLKPVTEFILDSKGRFVYDENSNRLLKEIQPALPVDDFENIPTSGFVLNKKAGGERHHFGQRQIKCRVFDPRGFEFEITMDNLLFILQETNTIKGKGLVGEFVYSWYNGDLILLPCDCNEYIESSDFTASKLLKISAKSLVPGYTYKTKSMEEVIYLGKFDYIFYSRTNYKFNIKNEHVFYNIKNENFVPLNAPNLAKLIDNTVNLNYAELLEKLQNSGKIKPFTVEINPLSIELKDYYDVDYYNRHINIPINKNEIYIDRGNNIYSKIDLNCCLEEDKITWKEKHEKDWYKEQDKKFPVKVENYRYFIYNDYNIIDNNIIEVNAENVWNYNYFSKQEITKLKFVTIKLNFNDVIKKDLRD